MKTSATRPKLRPAGAILPELGVGADVISGNRAAAFPAPISVVVGEFAPETGPGMAAGAMAGKRLAAFPGPISVAVALFGRGPRVEALAGGAGDGERVGLAFGPGLPDAKPAGLALGVGAGDAEPTGLDVGVGVGDAEGVGLAHAVGVGDAEGVGLALAVGDAEGVGLALAVGVGDAEGVGLAQAVGVGEDVEGDGLCALGPGLVLAAAGKGEGEVATWLAIAGSCVPTDRPQTRKAPVTRPAATARRRT